jgi:hypothetical protein
MVGKNGERGLKKGPCLKTPKIFSNLEFSSKSGKFGN